MKSLPTLIATLILPLAACAADAPSPGTTTIHLNQVGWRPAAHKVAVLGLGEGQRPGERFVVEDARGRKVFEGTLTAAKAWAPAGQDAQLADFSALRGAGTYRLKVDGGAPSDPFVIGDDAYVPLVRAALKAFYLNRASTALPARHAGPYARDAGHPDTDVRVHASAASPSRPAGTVISAPKGWYDAGDYNKYIVNSGISTWTLLAAYEHFPAFFTTLRTDIPDEAPGAPDVLQEVWWNLQWMLAMQDPADGGVYHKLTDLQFDGTLMPAQAQQQRYVVMKATAATLDFAAVMAAASRIYAPFERQYPGQSARMLAAARSAWAWAQQHPEVIYRQPDDVRTGGYDDAKVDDEFAWAAAELFASTGEPGFLEAWNARAVSPDVPSWGGVGTLGWITLAQHRPALDAPTRLRVEQELTARADALADAWAGSAWQLATQSGDFRWGSNSTVLNQAMVLLQGYRLSGAPAQRDAAQAALDYVLGRNPLGRSYVTGFGARPPLHIHHRISEADGVAAPQPGLLSGGPNPGQQDAKDCKATYASALPALSWLDDYCSYASNEVAINWNAPLVYVAGALQALPPTP